MTCPQCGSTHVAVNTMANPTKIVRLPWWYWLGFVWVMDLMIDMCTFGLIRNPIKKAIIRRKFNKVESFGVCQDCGYHWKIRQVDRIISSDNNF